MHAAAAATHGHGLIGFGYDPTLEAAEHGISISYDPTADDTGEYDPETRTITVRHRSRAYSRTTATYQLAHAVLDRPTREAAVEWAAKRLIAIDDLRALASATDDRRIWAKALDVRWCLLAAYLQIQVGLPISMILS